MKPIFSALILAMAVAGTGCALTETVTPPPPQMVRLPAEAQALLAQAAPECRDPALVKTSFAQQRQVIDRQQDQVRELIESEQYRWQQRHRYLERELNFYEKEVRRTGGNSQYTSAPPKPATPIKITTDGGFVDQIKRQREREYNEEQFRYFYRKLHRARAYHQKRMNLYQERLDQLTQATQACSTLQVTLRKAKEDEALQRNAQAAPPLPVLQIQAVPIEALPADALADAPMPDVDVNADADADTDELAASESPLPSEPETMEQLLAQPPLTTTEPEQATPVALEPPAQAEPVVSDVASESAPEAALPMAETMEQLLQQPLPQPWNQVAQPYSPGRR